MKNKLKIFVQALAAAILALPLVSAPAAAQRPDGPVVVANSDSTIVCYHRSRKSVFGLKRYGDIFMLNTPGFYVYMPPRNVCRDESRPEMFSYYFPAEFLLDVYDYLTADTTRVSNAAPRASGFGGGLYPDRHEGSEVWFSRSDAVHEGWGSGIGGGSGWFDIDNPRFPTRLHRFFKSSWQEYHEKYYKDRAKEKECVMLYLQELNAQEERPLVFTDIWRDYGGDIERYVDDIYDRSILINHKRMTNFCNYPRVKTFVSDPGVRFVISMELFRNAQKLKELQAKAGSVE